MARKLLIILGIILLIVLAAGFITYKNLQPDYSGTLTLPGLNAEVEVIYDAYGVPHIYAQSEEDAFLALGYVHAQDRLFQMELLRKVSSGSLSEWFGADLVETDKFFRTLGLQRQAQKSVETYWKGETIEPWQKASLAYLEGINRFIESGPRPIEFLVLGHKPEPFTITDIYLGVGFTSFGFAEGFREDPLITALQQKLGSDYLKDLILDWPEHFESIPVFSDSLLGGIASISNHTQQILDKLPIAPWLGSNGWVIGPQKSANGKVLFANDTHMGFAQPSVWYEAHIEAPGLSFYGNFMAGFPFPILGHNRKMAIGLTMFENDDTDFFALKPAPGSESEYLYGEEVKKFDIYSEQIKVKDAEPVQLEIKVSHYGPVINAVMPSVAGFFNNPIAVSWSYLQVPCTTPQASYNIMKAQSVNELRAAVGQINSPGLNVMYGDVDGNIAWFTTAMLWLRPEGQNGKLFLDGSTPGNEPTGFMPFEQNPHAINPPWHFVYSANNQVQGFDGSFYPGYYVPENRAKRIRELLEAENAWDIPKLEKMITEVHAAEDLALAKQLLPLISAENTIEQKALETLNKWDGNYQVESLGATLLQRILFHSQRLAFADDMGDELFQAFMGTHLQKRSLVGFILNDSSLWWMNSDANKPQTRQQSLQEAFRISVRELEKLLGTDPLEWRWGRVHSVEYGHPFGQIETLRPYFNVGPFAINGGNEVINNIGYKVDSTGLNKASFGPAMRRLIDFDNIARSQSVLPTGQSGNPTSPHYANQAELYREGKFRPQWMDRADIENGKHSILKLKGRE